MKEIILSKSFPLKTTENQQANVSIELCSYDNAFSELALSYSIAGVYVVNAKYYSNKQSGVIKHELIEKRPTTGEYKELQSQNETLLKCLKELREAFESLMKVNQSDAQVIKNLENRIKQEELRNSDIL